jgi:pimeloyl-ACP methyl ester carboxylesterase
MGRTVAEVSLSVSGVTLAGLAWGPEDGPPVLALHGWLDSAASFARLAEHLDPSLRLVAIDLPGHGRSGRRGAGAGYHDVDFVADALEAATALGWSRFSLLGHSMGARVAAMAAGAAADRVEGLALLEALGPLAAPASSLPHRLGRYAKLRGRFLDRAPRRFADLEEVAAHLVSAGVGLSPEGARVLAPRAVREGPGGLELAADPRLEISSPAALAEGEALALLGAIRCPALLVTATRGYGLDAARLGAHAAVVPGLARAEVEGRHYVHLDAPAAVAGLVGPHLLRAAGR